MKNILHFCKFLFVMFVLTLANTSCATVSESKQASSLLQHTLQSSVMFRGWDTKNYSKQTPYNSITLIAMSNLVGDIIILRWNETKTQFQSELYRQEDSGILKSWQSATKGMDKSIVQQPGGALHVFERVGGPEGGVQVEVIELDR